MVMTVVCARPVRVNLRRPCPSTASSRSKDAFHWPVRPTGWAHNRSRATTGPAPAGVLAEGGVLAGLQRDARETRGRSRGRGQQGARRRRSSGDFLCLTMCILNAQLFPYAFHPFSCLPPMATAAPLLPLPLAEWEPPCPLLARAGPAGCGKCCARVWRTGGAM